MTISTWAPLSNIITSITNSNPGVVTTATNHGYQEGIYVRLNIVPGDGMPEVSGQVFLATILSNTEFSIDTDTTNYTPFSTSNPKQVSQVIPVGEVASTLRNAERNTLPPVN